jgi:hypothetical protein
MLIAFPQKDSEDAAGNVRDFASCSKFRIRAERALFSARSARHTFV